MLTTTWGAPRKGGQMERRTLAVLRSASVVVLAGGTGAVAGSLQAIVVAGPAAAQNEGGCVGNIAPSNDPNGNSPEITGTTMYDHLDWDCSAVINPEGGPGAVLTVAESSMWKLISGGSQWTQVNPSGSGWNGDLETQHAKTDDSYSCGVFCGDGSTYKDVFNTFVDVAPGVELGPGPPTFHFPAQCIAPGIDLYSGSCSGVNYGYG